MILVSPANLTDLPLWDPHRLTEDASVKVTSLPLEREPKRKTKSQKIIS